MGYRYNRYERYDERPRRRGRGCLIAGVVFVWLVLGGLLLVRYVARPYVTNFLLERSAQRLRVSPGENAPAGGSAQQPGGIAVLPESVQPGTTTVSEADANQYLAANRDQLGGADVQLRFVPGQAQAQITYGGFTGTASAGLQVQAGRVVITNPQLGAPLNLLIDPQAFAQLLEERLNQDLASTGRTITGVTIGQGQLTIAVQ